MEGWICPRCGRSLAPWISECPCYMERLPITTSMTGTGNADWLKMGTVTTCEEK